MNWFLVSAAVVLLAVCTGPGTIQVNAAAYSVFRDSCNDDCVIAGLLHRLFFLLAEAGCGMGKASVSVIHSAKETQSHVHVCANPGS